MIFRVLGPVEAVHDGSSLSLGAPKQRCVLAALVLDVGHVVSVDRLCEAVWGSEPPAAARKALQVYVSNLRRALQPIPDVAITSHPDGYRLDTGPANVDVHLFRELVTRASSALRPAETRELLHKATRLWRGEILSGIGECPLRDRYAPALHEECLRTLEQRAAADLAAGAGADLVSELLVLVGDNPLRETAHGLLMRALDQSGRRSEALGVFRDLRRRLVDELGVEPGQQVARLHQVLLEAEDAEASGRAGGPDGVATAPRVPGPRPVAVPAQLPPDVPDFAGRAGEIERMVTVLTRTRSELAVIGLTGPGGAGKTALAVRAAHQARAHFPDGQLFADLRGSRDTPAEPGDVLAAFLRALGVEPDQLPADVGDRSGMFRTLLAGRRVLLVLDDASGALQVQPLLPGEAGCAVVVTARSRLFLAGSTVVALEELSGAEASELLASTVGPERVAAEPAAADAIVDACGRLPLALRIAGSRLATRTDRSLAEYADRLASARVLDELNLGDVGVRNSLMLSYQQLDEAEARTFRLLAAAEVSALSVPALACMLGADDEHARGLAGALVDLHLLAEPVAGRFRLHDLLRVLARELSEEADPRTEREKAVHALFVHLATTAVTAVRAMMPALGGADLDLERPARTLEFADAGSATDWLSREHTNVTAVSLHILRQPDPPLYALAQLTNYLGNYAETGAYWSGWQELSSQLLERAVAAGDIRAEMLVRMCAGGSALRHGDPKVAIDHLGRFTDHCRAHAEHTRLGRGLTMLALAHLAVDDYDEAFRCLRQALNAHRRGGNRRSYATTCGHLAELYQRMGPYQEAARQAETAIEVWRELGGADAYLGADSYKNLGFACAELGRLEEAIEWCETSMRLADEVGYTLGRRPLLAVLARACRDAGRLARAAGYFEQALAEPDDPRERPTASTATETLHAELSDVLTRMGRPEHAAASLRRAS
ncbi:AfsR/SARP family transcriptional regulator [Phytoactinopolyspora halotolerans]|uniref:Tetratricopeptide repeat protein n=1 Tax=Phytoactinopolyspora halotolerans TaxID=1981512 RepID=A0A6L9SCW0_9ACTN|nr:BTAD domain-containing putative transcriptional regulator [Phytoactinopolyspora halotolerans]NEE02849.1 tetratricopeptide repeat protein [Phytoactinopolyspora halotolerans]